MKLLKWHRHLTCRERAVNLGVSVDYVSGVSFACNLTGDSGLVGAGENVTQAAEIRQ
ncbi:MAG: hypothetical protein OXC63_10250 [Aestuariivita sp.]|nr:hypothetical protein [Aestuariivita sp.]